MAKNASKRETPVHKLRHVEDRFDMLLEAAPDAVVIVNESGEIVFLCEDPLERVGCSSAFEAGKTDLLRASLIPSTTRYWHVHTGTY